MAMNQISTSVTIINSGLIGYIGISLTDFDTSALSAIASGSSIEIAGAFFKADGDLTINASSWTAITTATNCYLYLTPSGTAGSQIITATWETNAPTWSTSKQGWYWSTGSNIRLVGRAYKISSTQQDAKVLFTNYENDNLISQSTANTRYGAAALLKNSGIENTSIGYNTLSSNTTGAANTAVGHASLLTNTIGNSNTAVGRSSMELNVSGSSNSCLGRNTLYNNTTGNYNVAIGNSSLFSNTTGANNTAVGYIALTANTTGANNTAVGYASLNGNISGSCNTALGYNTLLVCTATSGLVAIGYNSLAANTTGALNTAVGYQALTANTTGQAQVAIGYNSLAANTTGVNNTAVGYQALTANTTGINNTAVGNNSLFLNTTGVQNTAIGADSGGPASNISGNNNTFLGYNADNIDPNLSNIITLGNASVTTLRCQVTTITALSDERDKTNIKDISLGIDFINKMRPVTFNWDKREWYIEKILENGHYNFKLPKPKDGSKIGSLDYGFIAQELLLLQKEYPWLQIVNTDNPNILETTPAKVFPILIKAVQELYQEIQVLKGKLNA